MQCSVYSLFVVYTLWDLLFVFKMNSKCSRRSQLEHLKFLDAQVGFFCSLKYSKTIRRPGLCSGPHWGSSQRSPDPSWRGRGWLPLPKNRTPASALRGSGCSPSGLASPFLIISHFQIPFDATVMTTKEYCLPIQFRSYLKICKRCLYRPTTMYSASVA